MTAAGSRSTARSTVCRDAHEALRTAKKLGVDTILTSGQQARCADGAPLLRELVSESGEGLRILIGGGVNADVIRALASQTGADAFHLSAKAVVPSRHGVPPRKRPDGYSRTE